MKSKRRIYCCNRDLANLFRKKRGKVASAYMTYRGNREWNAKIFRGVIQNSTCTYFTLKDPKTKMKFILLYKNLDYLTL